MNNIYFGVIEDRTTDNLKLGRCKVRIVGIHTDDKVSLPTADLPWAIVMQPTNSAANSGVGYSPTGLVEGTTVMVMFRDEYNQHPIIIGTVPGISSKEVAITSTTVIRSGDGSVWVDGSGQPITSGAIATETVKPIQEITPTFQRPALMTTSDIGVASLKTLEGLASLLPGRGKNPKTGKDSTPGSTILYSYLDTRGIWTIGWGNTTLRDGSKVTETSTIDKTEADAILILHLKNDAEKSIKRNVKVPLTQSMFDSCVSMIYNMGSSGFANTTVCSLLNAGNYEAASAQIPFALNNGGTLKGRRIVEQTLFLRDGIPQDDGSTKVLPSETVKPVDATQNPAVIKDEKFTKVTTTITQPTIGGFNDPTGTYPKFTDEPDTHRLARGENINGTIVYKKEAARVKNVPVADGSKWTQPSIPYNAKYPYNRVYSGESGHIQEFDDSPGSERIHTYHKSGTFTEVDVNGTRVNRIVGDAFEIFERNGNVIIKGNCNITVLGDANLRVENNTTIESLGNLDIKVGGNIGIGAVGDIRFQASGAFSVDATRIDWNSGLGGSVKQTSGTAGGTQSFAPLVVPTRHDESNSMYETPEEGTIVDKTDEEEVVPVVPTEEKTVEAKPVVKAPDAGCDLIMTESSFGKGYRLTENFTAGDVFCGQSGIPTGTNFGLSANEIVCNAKQLTLNCLEPIKKKYPNLHIRGTWRSEAHNKAVGGVLTSDHLYGYAADIDFTGFNRQQMYETAQDLYAMLPTFQQIILEYKNSDTWIHISYSTKKGNKRQALTMNAATNKTLKSGGYVLA